MNLARITTLLALVGLMGCQPPGAGGDEKGPPGKAAGEAAEKPAEAPRPARRVEVRAIQPRDFDEMVEVTAAIEAIEDVTLTARASGTVVELLDRGDPVEKGQVVARLDPTLVKAAVAQADAAVAAARATLRLAEDALRRQKPLFEQDIISALEFENLQAQVAQAKAQVRQAEAGRAQAKAQLELTRVVAPFAGRVEDRFVEPGGQSNPGQPVLRVVDVARVKAVAGVPERYATDIRAGAAVEIAFNAYGVEPREAEVTFVGTAINASNRTFTIEAVLDNPDRLLKPQMVARLRVVRAKHPGALVVPLASIARDETGAGVFVVVDGEAGPIAQRRSVRLGARSGDQVEVEEGLAPGDRVVVAGQNALTNDDLVEMVDAAR